MKIPFVFISVRKIRALARAYIKGMIVSLCKNGSIIKEVELDHITIETKDGLWSVNLIGVLDQITLGEWNGDTLFSLMHLERIMKDDTPASAEGRISLSLMSDPMCWIELSSGEYWNYTLKCGQIMGHQMPTWKRIQEKE